MMGHLTFIARSGGKEDTAFRGGSSAVLRWDALGLVHLRLSFLVADLCYRVELLMTCFIKCMPVRVIQPILYRNQTTLQHGLIG